MALPGINNPPPARRASPPPQPMKTWNVRVHTPSGSISLGQVHETSEDNARCAALSKFGVHPDDDDGKCQGIREGDDFDVSRA